MNKNYYHVLLCFLFLFFILFGFKARASLPLQGKLIIVDPGHGGPDPGTSYKKIYEKDLNLKIAKCLEKELGTYGASVLLLRDGDYDLSGGVKKNRKRTDFNKRIDMINHAQGDLYISIHLNYLNNPKYYGAQVFYNKDNEKLALSIQNYLNANLNTNRNIKKIPARTYMYDKLKIPGVLIECGFLSNYEERNLLVTAKYQKKLAHIITKALVNYYY